MIERVKKTCSHFSSHSFRISFSSQGKWARMRTACRPWWCLSTRFASEESIFSFALFRSSLNRAMDPNISYVSRSWRTTRSFCGRRRVSFAFCRWVHRSNRRWSLKTLFKPWRNNCINRSVYACSRIVCKSFGISPIKRWNSFVFLRWHCSRVDCLFA